MKKIYALIALSIACSLQVHARYNELPDFRAHTTRLKKGLGRGWSDLGSSYALHRTRFANNSLYSRDEQPQAANEEIEEEVESYDLSARVMNYNQAKIRGILSLDDLDSAEFSQDSDFERLVKDGLCARAQQRMMPTPLDKEIFRRYRHSFGAHEYMQLARGASPLLFDHGVLLELAADEQYLSVFEVLYRTLPQSLEARNFVKYVLMVQGKVSIPDVLEYASLCRQYNRVFSTPESYTPLINEEVISMLAQSDDILDIKLLRRLVRPSASGVSNIQLLVPYMPLISSAIISKVYEKKDSFARMSREEKQEVALRVSIVVAIGNASTLCKETFPWLEVLSHEVITKIVHFCKKNSEILKFAELELPPVVARFSGAIHAATSAFLIKKIGAVIAGEARKQELYNQSLSDRHDSGE